MTMTKEEEKAQNDKRSQTTREKDRDRENERDRKRSRRDRDAARSPRREQEQGERQRTHSSPKPDRGREESSRKGPSDAPKVEEGNGEVSMSIEETNRVRISLGLKPLNVNKIDEEERAAKLAAAKRAEDQRKAKQAVVAERIIAQKERRLEQEKLRNIKTLGEAGADVDDLAVWVESSRIAEVRAKEEERAKAAKLARQLEEQDDVESEEEEVRNVQELAGMKVKHSVDELNEGETMVLTLADRSILDDKGEIDAEAEELENALVTEDKLRQKAFKAAKKENKPLFGEDGKTRGMLDKYDEEEQEQGMQIDASGAVEDAKRKRQEEIRARLKAAESAATSSGPGFATGSDFYTREEMTQFQKPKTKKKRKIRKKDTDEEEVGLNLAALEAEAAKTDAGKDRGSRTQRVSREAEQVAARETELKQRQERYDNALNKANIASLALQQLEAEDDKAEDDLQTSLARARRAALLKSESSKAVSADDIAAEAARRREERERREQEMGGGLEFSEAKDFANSIQLVKAEEPEAEEKPGPSAQMHDPEPPPAVPLPPPPAPPPKPAPRAGGGWVRAGEDAKGEEPKEETMEVDLPPAPPLKREHEDKPESLVREKNVGTGLAGAMSLLRERGELQQKVEWAGRTNDMKKEKLTGLEDVYQGGRHEDKLAADIEQALTERDEFGRVLTPKERFRRLCHNFHGKTISKTKQEKRLRKLQEEMDARRAATAEGVSSAFSRVSGQQMAGTPYKVLSGKLQPGQSSDPASGFATVDRQVAPTPVQGGTATPRLGGGTTPLVGDKKVEIMLGLQRDGAAKLPSPPVKVRKG